MGNWAGIANLGALDAQLFGASVDALTALNSLNANISENILCAIKIALLNKECLIERLI